MKYVKTLVVCSGPPRGVSKSIWPKVWKAKMDPTTKAKKIVGESIGSVTRQKRETAPAPPTSAASTTSSGIDWSPADIKMKLRPRFCQIVVTATATSATDGIMLRITGRCRSMTGDAFWRMDGSVLMPSHGSRPTCGFSRVPKITEATATEVATVEEKSVR